MKPWHSEEDVVTFAIAANVTNYPIFVHRQRGADRTGPVCGMYRVFSGLTKQEAIAEMIEGGFKFDPAGRNIVVHRTGGRRSAETQGRDWDNRG
jgi:hypothetical protein